MSAVPSAPCWNLAYLVRFVASGAFCIAAVYSSSRQNTANPGRRHSWPAATHRRNPLVSEDKARLRQERAARARAARAYADLGQEEIAEALGVKRITVTRMERQQTDITLDHLFAIADRCGVPRDFMLNGYDSVPDELRRIHGRFDALEATLGLTAAQAFQLSRDALEHLRAEPEVPPRANDVAG